MNCQCQNSIMIYRHNGTITVIVRNMAGAIRGFTEKTAKAAMAVVDFFFGLRCRIDKASEMAYLDLLLSVN